MATNELIDRIKEGIIEKLKSDIEDLITYNIPMDEAAWGYEQGILLTGNEAKQIVALLESQAKEPSDEDIENESKTSLSIGCRGIELPKEIRDLNLEILQKGFIIGAKAMRDGKIKTQTK